MRIIGEITHPQCKITLFYWNNKYLVKLERGLVEQTYKVPELEISGEDDVRKMVDDEFIAKAMKLLATMEANLFEAIESI